MTRWAPVPGPPAGPHYPQGNCAVRSCRVPEFQRPAGRRNATVDLLLLAVAVAWGSTYWVTKELVSRDNVLAVLAVRMTLTALTLMFILVMRRKRIAKSEWGIGLVLGLLLSTVFTFETFGIAATSATNAGLIISLTIVMTPALETVVGRRKLSRLFYLAAVIAIAGVYFLATGGAAASFNLGDLLILLAATARAVHVTGMHRLSAGRHIDSLHLTFVQMATCGIVFLALSAVSGVRVQDYVPTMDNSAVVQMIYLVVVCTVFPFFIQMWAVRKTSPTRVSLLLGTEPVWAAAIGVTLAGDVLGPVGILGVVLVLVGTMWGQRLELGRAPKAQAGEATPGEAGASREGGEIKDPAL
ncbi:DMT family transporter [Arthrobacter stackebrandtii]|uniref:DMT family transporter n=1 Tax=Arthrobacter stackebrandtii TaxID=272161 RepID=UPI000D975530|nr:DMT family transporter [Arthrobacter stackebrandtii]PYH01275.1 EamA family transporter [Arthrobacter stackebrandtii]